MFATTPLGLVLAIVSASISFVSCSIVLIIIARSHERLSSTYHRIMGMSSICILVASSAIAFTTIPMPKDVIFDYAGKSYGNVTTCTIQGLAYLFGYNLNFYLEKALISFYFLRIGLCVRQKYLTRFFDPLFIVVVIWVFLSLKADTGNFENINPSAIKVRISFVLYINQSLKHHYLTFRFSNFIFSHGVPILSTHQNAAVLSWGNMLTY